MPDVPEAPLAGPASRLHPARAAVSGWWHHRSPATRWQLAIVGVAGSVLAAALVVTLVARQPSPAGSALAGAPARLNAGAPTLAGPLVAAGHQGGGGPAAAAGSPAPAGSDAGGDAPDPAAKDPGAGGPLVAAPGPAGGGAGPDATVDGVDRSPGTVGVYAGLGTWVDAYDYAPAYHDQTKGPPMLPSDVDAMAAAGVSTLFIQASRLDDVSTGLLVDPERLAEIVLRAHARGMRVVGWYLPHFADVAADLARLQAIADFRVLDHGFDGIAVDIEDTTTVPDPAARGAALVELSQGLRRLAGSVALGAVVLPPVLTEVVNPRYWPGFPWAAIAPIYDVWLPMSYWTLRKPGSGYENGFSYSAESVQRLRADLGQPHALVHAIGGIADAATPLEIDAFLQSLPASEAIGGSLYDWLTLSPDKRAQLADGFAAGPAASLPRPP